MRFQQRTFGSGLELPVHCVQHFDCDQNGQGHCHWVRVVEDLAVKSAELVAAADAGQVMGQLPVGHLWAVLGEQEPP